MRAVRLTPQALKRTAARASAAAYPRPMPQNEADKYKAFGHHRGSNAWRRGQCRRGVASAGRGRSAAAPTPERRRATVAHGGPTLGEIERRLVVLRRRVRLRVLELRALPLLGLAKSVVGVCVQKAEHAAVGGGVARKCEAATHRDARPVGRRRASGGRYSSVSAQPQTRVGATRPPRTC